MKTWSVRALISLSIAVACARATDEKLLDGGDDSGGTSGAGASPFGGASGFGGTTSGGTSGKGGTTTGGASATGGATTGGKGGTTGGTGGSDSGGASDGGEGGADVCMPVGTPPTVRLDYKASMRAVSEDPEGEFRVVNGSTQPIPLGELTLRYWFHSEFTCGETTDRMMVNIVAFQFDMPYAQKNIPDVTTAVVDLGTGMPGCDAYFELGFASATGSLAPNQIATVKYFAQIPIYETARPHDQSNDYSYGACTTSHVYFDRVTLYRNGRLVSGTPPGGGGGEGGAGGEAGGGTGGI